MKRFTEKINNNWLWKYKIRTDKDFLVSQDGRFVEFYGGFINKLAEFEDAEENGLLLRLPCKTHDYLYAPGKIGISIFKVIEFEYSAFDFFVTWKVVSDCLAGFEASGTFVQDIGKTVFLTMEEAEKALKELRGEN